MQVASGDNCLIARRSDGDAVAWGFVGGTGSSYVTPPALQSGAAYLHVAAGYNTLMGLVGSESRYVTFASGCAGSLPSSSLIPRDTPRIGETLQVTLSNLPTSVAMIAMGWSKVTPGASLAFLGMPNCAAHVTLDGVALLTGTGNEAVWTLPIPYQAALLGVHFHNQAFVLDPAAGNAIGAVVSDAAEAVVGG